MPKGISYLEALLGLLLLSSALLSAFAGVLKALSFSQHAVANVQQQMLLTDLYQSSLQRSSRCDDVCNRPNPAWQQAFVELQLAMPHLQFHLCDHPHRLSWYVEQPDPQYTPNAPCQLGDNQALEVVDAPRL